MESLLSRLLLLLLLVQLSIYPVWMSVDRRAEKKARARERERVHRHSLLSNLSFLLFLIVSTFALPSRIIFRSCDYLLKIERIGVYQRLQRSINHPALGSGRKSARRKERNNERSPIYALLTRLYTSACVHRRMTSVRNDRIAYRRCFYF